MTFSALAVLRRCAI